MKNAMLMPLNSAKHDGDGFGLGREILTAPSPCKLRPRQLDVVRLPGLGVVHLDLQHREPALEIARAVVRALLGLELGLDLTIDHDGIAAQWQVVAGLVLSR